MSSSTEGWTEIVQHREAWEKAVGSRGAGRGDEKAGLMKGRA